jgi:hypothetical protein
LSISTSVLSGLSLLLAASQPTVAQEKSVLVVRPGIIPDSLKGMTPVKSFDTVRVSRNWGKLKKGETEAEVKKLLGLPPIVHLDPVNGWNIWWYGKRSVAFNSLTNRVSHWDEILDH